MSTPHPGLAGGPLYLDYNATTPVDPCVRDAMLPYLGRHFGNPSSGHPYADVPRRGLAAARDQIRALLGAVPPTTCSPPHRTWPPPPARPATAAPTGPRPC